MSQTSVLDLFATAQDDGLLSPGSAQAFQVLDLGAQIQAALGAHPDDLELESSAFILTIVVDDSGSIRFVPGNTEAVRNGHNMVIQAFLDSKQSSSILASTRYLNGHVLFDYRPLDQAVLMSPQNYNPSLGTPLYDATVLNCGGVVAKVTQMEAAGVPCRSATLFISDGADEHSPKARGGKGTTPAMCRTVIEDLLRQETHIVAAMGISDGTTDFRKVFGEMGIRDEWILTPGNSPSELRAAFQVFSKSAVRASQTAGNFSKLGGFGAP